MLSTIYDEAQAFDKSLVCRQQAAAAKSDNSWLWIDVAHGLVWRFNRPAEAREILSKADPNELTCLAKAYLPYVRGIICWREQDLAQGSLGNINEARQLFQATERFLIADRDDELLRACRSACQT